jgi:drug/metabolite transporter (DMT)-like permease
MNITRQNIVGVAFGFGAALAYGASNVMVRQGLGEQAPPLVSCAISMGSGALILGLIGLHGFRDALNQSRRSVGIFMLAGTLAGLAIISSFFALSIAPVVIVSPLQSTSPLFALLWSRLLLGHLEKMTMRLVCGTTLVVVGVALIALGRLDF